MGQGTNDDLFATVRAWTAKHYPGNRVRRVVLALDNGEKVRLPVPPAAAPPAEAEEENGQPRHSADFRSVHARGRVFSFTPTQAAVVKALWDAAEHETPEVGQDMLLETAGSESKRLRDLFRKGDGTMHPAWGLLIVPEGKGAFRLDLGV